MQVQAAAIVKQLDADTERLTYLFGAQLEAYCRQKVAQGRRRTVHFLQASCSFRSMPASVRIADPGAALEHALHAVPVAVRTVTALDAGAYRDQAAIALAETGTLLPGCETTPAKDTFSVRYGPRNAISPKPLPRP